MTYREAANAFAIVDNLAFWRLPEKNDEEYRTYWKERFGIDAADGARLAAWGDVRKRTYPEETDSPVLLGRSKPLDRLAAAFYAEQDLDKALALATTIVGAADASILRDVFAGLKPKLDVLLAESRAFTTDVPVLQAKLDAPKVSAFVDELARFYKVDHTKVDHGFTVEYVWWPPIDDTSASVIGSTLLLRYHPTKHVEEARRHIDVPVHEIVHFVSEQQPEAQKLALSEAFAKKCGDVPAIVVERLFEEPLTVAHQKMFLADADPARFDRERLWYGDPWVSVMAKLIYEPVVHAHAQHRVLDERSSR